MQELDLTLFEKYRAELNEELELDEFTLKDKQMKQPANRHKWVARLTKQKYELFKLKALRAKAIDQLIDNIRAEEPITVSDATLKKRAARHDIVLKIDNEIANSEILISYLDKVVEKVCRGVSFDMKNLIDLIKLETT